jgi:hypothetical protein
MSDRQEELEDTKQVIRIRRSKKGRQHNGQKRKDKQQSTKHAHKTKVHTMEEKNMINARLQDPSHVVYNRNQLCQAKSMRQSSHNFHSINGNMCLLLDQQQSGLETNRT